ncbi:MAG: hypothetical protein IT198_11290 [Acidimicrobiia bacterium]|nr:hypothetical protein [Acidimicrobiia bacterium]
MLKVLHCVEIIAALGTVLSAVVALVEVCSDDTLGWPSPGSVIIVVLFVVGVAAVAMGSWGARSSRHLVAGIGFLVGAVTPTFFFYLGNILLILVAIAELVLWVRQRWTHSQDGDTARLSTERHPES